VEAQLREYAKPKFLVVGDHDSIIPLLSFQQHIKDIPEGGRYEVVTGADHFWQGYEEEVAQKVTKFFTIGFNHI